MTERFDRGGAFRALNHQEFRSVYVAQLSTQLGFWGSHVSLQKLMTDIGDDDPTLQGLLFFFLFIPALLVTPFTSPLADRLDRRRLLMTGYLIIVAWASCMAWLTFTDRLTAGLLLLVGGLLGVAFSITAPAAMGVVANAVPPRDIASAVSLQSASGNFSRIVGPLAVAPFLVRIGVGYAFVFYAAAAVIALALLSRVRLSAYTPDPRSGAWQTVVEGMRHAAERSPALPAIGLLAVLSFFGVSTAALLPIFVTEELGHADAGQFVYLVAAVGVGAVAGALLVARMAEVPTLASVAIQAVAYGGCLVALAVAPTLLIAVLVEVVLGFFYFGCTTRVSTLLQSVVDDSKRGRVMGLFHMSLTGLVPIGSLVGGLVAKRLGVAETLAAGGVVIVVVAAAVLIAQGEARSGARPDRPHPRPRPLPD